MFNSCLLTVSLLVEFREMEGQGKMFNMIEITVSEKFHYKNVYVYEFSETVRQI